MSGGLKRVVKSSVDWVAFAERVPPNQRDAYRAFKTKSDMFVAKVHRYPENLPAIDFAFYSSRLANPALVAEFEKAYKTLQVPYPKDKGSVKAKVDAEEKEAMEVSKKLVAQAKGISADAKNLITKFSELPGPDVMTLDMWPEYFPEQALNPWERPTFWPHTKGYQPENDPHTIP